MFLLTIAGILFWVGGRETRRVGFGIGGNSYVCRVTRFYGSVGWISVIGFMRENNLRFIFEIWKRRVGFYLVEEGDFRGDGEGRGRVSVFAVIYLGVG